MPFVAFHEICPSLNARGRAESSFNTFWQKGQGFASQCRPLFWASPHPVELNTCKLCPGNRKKRQVLAVHAKCRMTCMPLCKNLPNQILSLQRPGLHHSCYRSTLLCEPSTQKLYTLRKGHKRSRFLHISILKSQKRKHIPNIRSLQSHQHLSTSKQLLSQHHHVVQELTCKQPGSTHIRGKWGNDARRKEQIASALTAIFAATPFGK